MILDIGVLLISYAGVRLFEKYREKTKLLVKAETVTTPPTTKLIEQHKDNSTEAALNKQDRYVKLSVVNMGVAAIRQFVYPQAMLLNMALYAYLTMPTFRRAEKTLTERQQINGYVLDTILIALTPAIGQYFASSFAVWLHHLGQKVIVKTQNHSQQVLTHIFEQQPQLVWLVKDGIEIEVPLTNVQVNDIVVVNAGEVIPVDGIISTGTAMIDQQALTGEAQLAEKIVNDHVFAATVVVNGRIVVKVTSTGQDTTIAKIGQILANSVNFKTHFQSISEDWADKSAVPMLIAGALTLPLAGLIGTIGVLYCNISGPIRLVGSLGTLNHISLASYHGILIKDGRAIEFLKQVDTILFDKTGTLTTEQPEVGQIITCSEYKPEEILTFAAAAERKLTHPIAKAIVSKAQTLNLALPNIEDSKYQMGFGITVQVDNLIIKVGSTRFMKKERIHLPHHMKQALINAHEEGNSLVIVAINNQVSGAIEIQASVRPEVKTVIADLRQRGIKHLAIVSGDHEQPTRKLATSLGMDSYFYDVLPKDKAKIVEQLQQEGKSVCFIGDGVNDAIALKKANIAISLRGASSIATDMAQIVFMDGTLTHLGELFNLADELEHNLKTSLIRLIVPGLVNIGGVLFFHIGLFSIIIISNGGVALGIINAMSPLKKIDQYQSLAHQPNSTCQSLSKEEVNDNHLPLR